MLADEIMKVRSCPTSGFELTPKKGFLENSLCVCFSTNYLKNWIPQKTGDFKFWLGPYSEPDWNLSIKIIKSEVTIHRKEFF